MFATQYVQHIRNNHLYNEEAKKIQIEFELDNAFDNGTLDLNYVGVLKYTHLTFAVEQNDFITAKWLLIKGVNVNQGTDSGKTALHIAARDKNDSTDMLNLLLQYGADPGKELIYYTDSFTGNSFIKELPIMSAARYGNINIFRILFDLQFTREGYSSSLLNVLNTVKKIFTLLQLETETVRRACINYRSFDMKTYKMIPEWEKYEVRCLIDSTRDQFLIKYLGITTINIEELKQILEYHPENLLVNVHSGIVIQLQGCKQGGSSIKNLPEDVIMNKIFSFSYNNLTISKIEDLTKSISTERITSQRARLNHHL